MLRRRLGVAVSLGLLLVLSLTFLTGFIAAALDLNRFAYHKYAAYLAIALAAAHVALHWRSLTGQVRRWLLGVRAPTTSALPPAPSKVVATRLSRRPLFRPAVLVGAGAELGS